MTWAARFWDVVHSPTFPCLWTQNAEFPATSHPGFDEGNLGTLCSDIDTTTEFCSDLESSIPDSSTRSDFNVTVPVLPHRCPFHMITIVIIDTFDFVLELTPKKPWKYGSIIERGVVANDSWAGHLIQKYELLTMDIVTQLWISCCITLCFFKIARVRFVCTRRLIPRDPTFLFFFF